MAMNNIDMLNENELEALFEAARDTAPMPSQALWDRVHAGAEAALPTPHSFARTQPVRVGLLAGLIAAIGGWPSLAGLATATLAGVWIGFSNPEALTDSSVALLLPGLSQTETYELEDFDPGLNGFSAMLEEG
ncbi:MAG: hypothetical protein GY945_01930 [Rhodobacteraceae bacterium]|nr:hypothetical protein [Paracoccaceae bacterium]